MTITETPHTTRRLTTSMAMVEAIAQEMERDPSVFYTVSYTHLTLPTN